LDLSEKVLETLRNLLYVGVGALAGLGASWFLQNKAFKRQRLDQAREKVYGPLAWELEKMYQQVEEFDSSPSHEVADRIRDQEHLEWMIESKDMRTEIVELYDNRIPKFRDTITDLIRAIDKKLEDDLLQHVGSVYRLPPSSPQNEKELGQLVKAQETMDELMHKSENRVPAVVRGLAWPILRSGMPKPEDMENRRLSYQELLVSLPKKLEWSSFDDYFAEATKMFEQERKMAEEAKRDLLEKIQKIQQEIEKPLKPD